MKQVLEKVAVLLLGLVFMLVGLELSLRVVSHYFWRPTSRPGMTPERDLPPEVTACTTCIRILCAGDSFTYGFGATDGNTYPEQLNRILNARRPEHYVVINAGRGAASTTTVLETLDTHLEALPIDLVVLMAGNSNVLNFSGYLRHLYGSRRLSAVSDILFRLRVVRYGWYVATALRGRTSKANTATWPGFDPRVSLDQAMAWWKNSRATPGGEESSHSTPTGETDGSAWEDFLSGAHWLDKGDLIKSVAWFKRGVKADPTEGANYYGMGVANQLLDRYDDAAGWFRAGIRENPNDPTLYDGLGEVLMAKAGPWNPIVPADLGKDPFVRAPIRETWNNPSASTLEAVRVLKQGIGVDSSYSGNHCALGTLYGLLYNHQSAVEELEQGIQASPDDPRCYPALVEIGRLIGRRDEFIAYLEAFETNSDTARRYLAIMRSERDDYAAWIRSDLGKMVTMCRERDIPVVFLEYPQNSTVNAIMREVARKANVPVVANEAYFRRLLDQGTAFDELFVPDGHCNDRGYGILATRLFEKLASEGLLDAAAARVAQ